MRRPRVLFIAAALLLLAGACSDDGESPAVESGQDTATSAPDTTGADGTTDTTTDTTTGTSDTTTAPSEPIDPDFVSETYADAAHWLCRPDMADDPCETDLDVTVVHPDGTTEVEPHVVAEDAPFDCFYVYPTINMGDEGNAPFDGEYGPELGITHTQAGHFSSMCDVYAPVYRQVTMGAFGSADEADVEAMFETAYGDVEESFRHYLANDNDGRPFVLMGHSQGSGMIATLMANLVDDNPGLRDQLVSALVIGNAVAVPPGEDVGGDYDNLPACREASQTGCIVSYASFRDTEPPAEDALFGAPREGEGVAICTNPAALAGGSADLAMIDAVVGDQMQRIGVEVATPYVALPGLVSGACVERDGRNYLEITVHPGDGPRVDDVFGDLGPQWGLHAIDYNLAFGDLLDLVSQQAEAWTAAHQ